MDAKVTWKGRMTFEGSAESGFNVALGTDPAVGGDNDGLRPMELIALGLAGCTAMDVISILQKKRQDVTAFETQVHATRAAEHPKIFTHIMIEYFIEGRGIDSAAVERAIELSETKYCPAQAMLAHAATIEHRYTVKEAV
jgi:putative redox protein